MPKNPLTLPCIFLSAGCALSLACSISLTAERFRNASFPENAPAATCEAAFTDEAALPVEEALAEPWEIIPAEREVVYIYDNGTDSVEYPLIEGVPLSDWDMERLVSDSESKRRALFGEDGEKRTRFGIDVSSHQGLIDWERAAADGVEFAFIRIGYRGYETGRIVEDARFRRNIELAQAAGIEVGVYFFSQAISPEEGAEEADFVLSVLSECGAAPQLPIVFDWEHPSDEDPARTDDVSGEVQTAACRAFCDRIAEAGYSPCYYATIDMALFRYDLEKLKDIPLWLAEYTAETYFPYEYAIWQYTSSGEIDGIEGLTDFNIMTF